MADIVNQLANHYYRKVIDDEIKYARAEADFFKTELAKTSQELISARKEIVSLRRDLLAARVRSSSVSARRNSESASPMPEQKPIEKVKVETPVDELKELVSRVVDITKCSREQALYALHHNDDDLKRAVGAIFDNNLDNLNLTNRYDGRYRAQQPQLPEWYQEDRYEGAISEGEDDQVVMLEDNVLAVRTAPVINLRSSLQTDASHSSDEELATSVWPNHIKRVLSSPSLITGK